LAAFASRQLKFFTIREQICEFSDSKSISIRPLPARGRAYSAGILFF